VISICANYNKGGIFISLNSRLLLCASLINQNAVVCDVGTDHAFLPIYLIENGLCNKVIASDINEGPLESAAKNIEKSGLHEKIFLVKSDGLKKINKADITDVVIAGMGSDTICKIIDEAEWLKQDINIILQPMTKASNLRRWLYSKGFEIVQERAVTEEQHIYTVMKVKYCGYKIQLNDIAETIGKLKCSEEASKQYVIKQFERINKVIAGLSKAGRLNEDIIKNSLLLDNLKLMITGNHKLVVKDIFEEINKIASFETQESWDNSGLIVGDMYSEVTRVMLALDITNEVVEEAINKKVDLIISHHPVIFKPLKFLSHDNPAVKLIKNNISAICVHTPIDVASEGINDILFNKLKNSLGLLDFKKPIVSFGKDSSVGYGRVGITKKELTTEEIAKSLKEILNCKMVKYTNTKKHIESIALCSGSGGSFFNDIAEQEVSVYITSDVKHDVWIEAMNKDIALFDCGHFSTETIVLDYIQKVLSANVPCIEFIIAESNKDNINYMC
jgi:dinuclear metal center YbgI/SA1388 family protein